MALCVQIQPDGTLVPTGDDATTCPAYVLLSGSEYSFANAMGQALEIPDVTTALGWFTGPFCFVVIVYMAARSSGAIINMFR
jgi:hypothetical protein